MVRKGYSLFAIVRALIILPIIILPVSAAADPDLQAPVLILPNDTGYSVCLGDSICFDVSGTDQNSGSSMALDLVAGPVEMEQRNFSDDFTTTVCWVPDAPGVYLFAFRLSDGQHIIEDSVTFTIEMSYPPDLADQEFSDALCTMKEPRTLELTFSDPEGDWRFSLLSGPGSIDSLSGAITYQPDTSGQFFFEVIAVDDCGEDTALITDNVALNLPPYGIGYDTTFYLCGTPDTCFYFHAYDPEEDAIVAELVDGLGTFEQVDDSTWRSCFTPSDFETFTYEFIYRVVDSCVLELGEELVQGDESDRLDTIRVTVHVDHPPSFIDAGPQSFFLCEPGDTCFSIDYTNEESDTTTLSVVSGNATLDGKTVCVTAAESGTFDVVIVAEDDCGSDTLVVPVTVQLNRPPVISIEVNGGYQFCDSQQVCLRVFPDDPDFNISHVEVSEFATYNPDTKSVCFLADTTGDYVLTAIGTDSCGVADTTTVTVPISINEAPAISFESDNLSIDFCEVSTIVLPVQVDDDNPSLIFCPGPGTYVADSNAVLFTPAVSGEYPISVVIVDDCDLADTASILVSARIGTPPSIQGLNDTSLYLCYPEHICLVPDIVDAEGDYDSIIVSEPFSIDGSGNICMDAYTMGDYELTLRVVDSCGFVAESTVTVSILTDQAVNIIWPTDDSVELCYADTLCYKVDSIPYGATVTVGGTNVWWNEETSEVCFYSDCCLENIITVSVTTPCGTYSHEFTVNVKTNQRPLLVLPADTTMLLCAPATICLPIGVSDRDDDIGSVIVTGADYDDYNDEICFAADSAGTYFIHASVTDTCGLQSEDSIYVTVQLNSAPDVSADTPMMPLLCELPEEVVLTYSVADTDNNIADTTTSLGTIDGDQIRFNPPDFGDYTFEIVAVDSCGLADTVNVYLRLERDTSWVSLSLPESLDSLVCDPDTIYFDISPYIDGSGYEIEVSPWAAFANGHVRVYSGEGLFDTLLIVGITPCETDTARVLVNIDVVDDLIIEDCPDDTSVFMCAPDTIPFPITLSGTGGPQGEFVVLPPAYYEGDSIMVPVLHAGTQTVMAIASSGFCGADTCTFDVSAVFNSTPGIIRADTSVSLCDAEMEEVCLPVQVLDPDDNFRDLTSPDSSIIIVIDGTPTVLGANSAATEEGEDRVGPIEATVCFTPETYDVHEITLIATDSCDAADTITFIVTVNQRNWVRLGELGEPIPPITVCGGPGTACLVPPFAVSGAPDSIVATDGSLGDSLCFFADTSGTYTIEVIGYAECNVDTLTFEVEVALVYAPVVTCTNADTAIFVCSTPDTARFQVDIDGTYDLLTVLPPDASYEDGYLVVPITDAGQITAQVKVENDCGVDSCGFVIDVSINTLPTISIAPETDTVLCVLDSVCLPISIDDPDGNVYSTGASYGVIAGDSLRFMTDTAGWYEIRLWAVDECDTVETIITVNVTEGEQAQVTPEDSTFNFTFDFTDPVPDTAHIPVAVFPDTARATVEPYGAYDPAAGELVAYISDPGTYDFYIIAETECGADTGRIQIVAAPYISPEIVFCGDTSYAGLCLLEPDTVCAVIEAVGTDIQVEVGAGGYYENSIACIPVDTAGLYTVRVIASNELEADTCYFDVTVTSSVEPEVTILETLDTALCGPDTICIPASVFDVDADIDTIYTNIGKFSEADNLVCFQADAAGVYEITLTAIDLCLNETVATAVVNVDFNLPPDITIDPAAQFVCDTEAVCISVSIIDSNLDSVTTNLGPWAPQTSTVCFYPDTSGLYTLTVTAVDLCGEEIIRSGEIEIERNEAPTIENFSDSTIYICMPQPICLSPLISDGNGPEDIASVTVEGATYENGNVCITPYTAGDYVITLTVEDLCGATDSKTITVTVLTDQVIDDIVWPSDTLVELCEADTLRFKVDSLPDGVTVTVGGTNVWWDEQTSEVAFYSDCCLENIITVTVNTGCGSYSHQFTVTVKTNIRPLVVLPQDTTIVVCDAGPVCLPIGITDEDGNLESVVVDSPFVYDDYKDRICFDADTAGIYAIQVIVADTCGLADTAAAQVTIMFNSAPVISYAGPQDTVLCAVQQVCLPIGIIDSEDNIDTVTVTGGSYNAGDGTVCFTPSQLDATHCFTVVTLDDCGLSDSVDVCVDIIRGDTVSIRCPDTAFTQAILCAPGPVCRELIIVGDSFSVDVGVNGASWENDTVCFEADTSGIYAIPVTATARCNVAECTLTVPVEILDTVRFTLCPSSTSEFRCSADTARYLYALEGDVDSVRVNAPSVLRDDTILVPLSQDGTVPVTLIADGYCGSDTCSFTVEVDINEAPELSLGPDISLVEFDLFRICVALDVQDQEGNLAQISSQTPGVEFVNYDSLCFTPPGFDTYVVDVTVTDSCDLSRTDTIVINIDPATMFCPDGPQYADICDSADICLFMPIDPPDAGIQVTVLPSGTYNPVDRTTCIFADSGGTYEVMVIAETPNTADTCEFELRVTEAEAPTISCPALIDTVLCVAVPETLYVPIEVAGTGIDVTVSPFGYYSAQTIILPIPGAGTFDVDINVTGLCGDTTCSMTVVIEADQPPVFVLPQGLAYEWCPGDIGTIYDTITATDTRSDVTIEMICGPSNSDFLMIGPGVAEISFVPDTAGSYRFCFEATDGCSPAQDTLYVDIVERDDCDVCVRASIDGGECTPVGLRKSVAVNVETNARIGGFDLLLSYDAAVMSFVTATTAGGVMTEWEYFTWNLGGVNCLPSCPSGLVRFVAYADQADGMGSPPDSAFEPNGTLFYMEFQIANDQNLGGTFPQINFVWYDCADNIFSDPTGLLAFVDTRIYSHEGLMRWDEEDEINFPESGRYPNLGTPDSCLTGETGTPNRCVEFIQGGVCIIHPDSIDARGDINLNGIAYEISDVVIFTNYFIKGLSAFTINIAAQIAATDVNADGITLSVADLSYLIRVVTGDADPIPKTVPYAEQATIETTIDPETFSITTETVGDIGAAYLIYDLDPGIEITEPALTSAVDGLSLQWGLEEGRLKLLIFDLGTDRIAPGRNRLIEIPYSGDGSIELTHSELVDYYGKPYRSMNLGTTLPDDYWLGQNYPNPFNPTTTVRFSLGKPGSWTLTVYNIAGGLVREFTGIDEGGPVEVFWDGLNRNGETIASGIYLYRLEAGEFTASRKMLLLK